MAAEDGQLRWRWQPTGSSARLLPRAGVRAAPGVLVRDSPAVTIPWEPAQQTGSGALGSSATRRGPAMARLWEQARRILSQQGAPGSPGLDRGFCIVQLKASANLRSISVRQLSTTLIACSPRIQPSPFAGSIAGRRHAPSRREFLAAGQQVSGRKPRPPETSGPRFPASHPGRDHLKLRGRSGYVTGSFNARRSHSSRGRAGRRSSSCRPDLI